MDIDISVEVCGVLFKNPIIASSASYSSDDKGIERLIKKGFGGVVTKAISKKPAAGAPPPRLFWYDPFEKTWVDSQEAHRNPGIERMYKFIKNVKDVAKKEDCRIIGNVAVNTLEASVEVAMKFEEAGVDAIELDMICPNVGEHLGPEHKTEGAYWGNLKRLEIAINIMRSIKKAVNVPVWPKINPNTIYFAGDKIVREAGVNGFSWLGQMFPNFPVGLAIDLETCRPLFPGNILLKIEKRMKFIPSAHTFPIWPATVLSTACIKWKLTRNGLEQTVLLPSGGIRRGFHALQVMMCGANAVQVCTAIYRDINVIDSMLREILWFLNKKGFKNMREVIGKSLQFIPFELMDCVPQMGYENAKA